MKFAKTTIYVAEGDYRRLKAIAREQKRATAELVRDAIAEYARRHGQHVRPRSVALARSGRGDLSERAEELLTGMGRWRCGDMIKRGRETRRALRSQ